jgi:transcriptional regulator with XRE-family HTH domain
VGVNTIRFCRLRAGLTQQELARKAGMSQSALARLEAGRVKPRVDTMARLLRECRMSLELFPISGAGVDRTTIRKMLALPPRQRLRLAVKEARNVDALKPRRLR